MLSPRRPRGPARAALLALLLLTAAGAAAAQNLVSLVSVSRSGETTGNDASARTAASADGRFIAFTSRAADLIDGLADANAGSDVFVRDRLTGQTACVSRNRGGVSTGDGESGLLRPDSTVDISADGRFVVFESEAADLVAGDTNGAVDVFVHDRQAGTTSLVSARRAAPAASGNGPSFKPQISADGRTVVFVSSASDLSAAPDANGLTDVYARRLDTLATELVSARAAGGGAGNDHSSPAAAPPSVSDNGRLVVFESGAGDLVANDTNGGGPAGGDVFVRDLVADTTTLVSANAAGTGSGNDSSFESGARLSGNGRFAVFASRATDLAGGRADANADTDVFIRDLVARTTALVSVNRAGTAAGGGLSRFPDVSRDGRYVAFTSRAGDLVARDTNGGFEGGFEDVFVRDTQAGTTELVSVNAAGTDSGNGSSNAPPGISADGRFVVFASRARNLTTFADPSDEPDLFRRDLRADTTALITLSHFTLADNGATGLGTSLSDDGRVVAFESRSTGLVTQFDRNDRTDVFVYAPAASGFFVGNVSVAEGDSGSKQAVFTVTLAAAEAHAVTVEAVTFAGSAAAGADFRPVTAPLTFAPGETSKAVSVSVLGDTLFENTETFRLELRNAAGAPVHDGTAVGTIVNDDAPPAVSVGDVVVVEGDDGLSEVFFTATLSRPSGLTASFSTTTSPGTATAADFVAAVGGGVIGAGQLSTTMRVVVLGDTLDEPDETFFLDLTAPTGATLGDGRGVATILDDEGAAPSTVQFAVHATNGTEVATAAVVNVTRAGDLSAPATVEYATASAAFGGGAASERSDYNSAFGRLRFAAGESRKSVIVFITDDRFVEGQEFFSVTLSNPSAGLRLGGPHVDVVRIHDDDTEPSAANPADDPAFFVRQHYRDFLGRDPDPAGLNFWTGNITTCGPDARCVQIRRENVSAAFFLSIEFQETGYLVYRMYKAAFGDINPPAVPVPVRLEEFLRDSRLISEGVQVGVGNWQQRLEANKNAFAAEFVTRGRFASAYPAAMTAAQFVDALNAKAGGALSAAERDRLVEELAAGGDTPPARARALRRVAEDADLARAELNKAFVLMQYFGYLRRNPDDGGNRDFGGWRFWLGKLNSFGGDWRAAEMVKAFIVSTEYRQRFGQ